MPEEFKPSVREFFEWLDKWFTNPSEAVLARVLGYCRWKTLSDFNAAAAELARYYGVAHPPEVVTLEEAEARGMSPTTVVSLNFGFFNASYDFDRNIIVFSPLIFPRGSLYTLMDAFLHEFYHYLICALLPAEIRGALKERKIPEEAGKLFQTLCEGFAEGKASGIMPLVEEMIRKGRFKRF